MREVYPDAGLAAAGLRNIRSQGNLKRHEASDCREALALLRGENLPLRSERNSLPNIATGLPAPMNRIVFARPDSEYRSANVLDPGR